MKLSALAPASIVAAVAVAGCAVEPPRSPAAGSGASTMGQASAVERPSPAATQGDVQASAPSSPSPPSPSDGGAGEPATPAAPVAAWATWASSGGEKPNTDCKKESAQELCFDAVDNDCNGLVDEGCPGYRNTGNAVQLTLAWKHPVDLDMRVHAPDGSLVDASTRESGALVFDKDCSGAKAGVDDCPAGKVENVVIPEGRAVPKGRYKVSVELADPRGQKVPQIPFFVGGKIGAQTFYVAAFVANKKGDKKTFEVDVD